MTRLVRILGPVLGGVLIIAGTLTAALLWLPPAKAAEGMVAATANGSVAQWAMMAAAVAAGLSSLGAGIAVASVGSAAVGALAEKPELLGRVLIIVGLAEGIAIYGLIVAILILSRVG
ncbi:MAG: ATP synthase subunit C [Rhodomicrobium sp.]